MDPCWDLLGDHHSCPGKCLWTQLILNKEGTSGATPVGPMVKLRGWDRKEERNPDSRHFSWPNVKCSHRKQDSHPCPASVCHCPLRVTFSSTNMWLYGEEVVQEGHVEERWREPMLIFKAFGSKNSPSVGRGGEETQTPARFAKSTFKVRNSLSCSACWGNWM